MATKAQVLENEARMRRELAVADSLYRLPDEFPSLKGQGMISVDTEGHDPELAGGGSGVWSGNYVLGGVSVGTEAGFRQYYPVGHSEGPNLPKDRLVRWLKRELKTSVPKVGANLLYDLQILNAEGIEVGGPLYDIQIAEPLLNEDRFSYSLGAIARDRLGVGKKTEELSEYLIATHGRKNHMAHIAKAPAFLVAPYAISDIDLPLKIFDQQRAELEAQGLWGLFVMESKLIPMLAAMRRRGVRVDIPQTEAMLDEVRKRYKEIHSDIKRTTGYEVEPWETKSFVKLFDDAGIPYPLTPKTQKPSFTAGYLEQCEHPVAQQIVELRRLDKLDGTFLVGSILNRHHDGIIHCNFNQLKGEGGGAVSGRFSCVAGWTIVSTRTRGRVCIRDVRVGDEVWTHRRRWRKVTRTWLKGSEDMLEIHFSNDRIMTCTKKHRVMMANGDFLEVADLVSFAAEVMTTFRLASSGVNELDVTITCVREAGPHEVYDITVEEDESYAACGIFSHNSSAPNLQFIPVRTEEGKKLRKLFKAMAGKKWYKRDFSQIEYRLMVHDAAWLSLPGAKEVVDEYHRNPDADFHTKVAEMVFGRTDKDARVKAKTINFGLAYGEGKDKLARQLGVEMAQALAILDEYHRRAPFMRRLAQGFQAEANRTGEVKTLLGRIRRFNAWEVYDRRTKETKVFRTRVPGAQRAFTYKAMNARTQGSAADVMKKSMVDAWESGVFDVLGVPALTVHDELDGDFEPTRACHEALKEMDRVMENCVKLLVPLRVDGSTGPDWGSCE